MEGREPPQSVLALSPQVFMDIEEISQSFSSPGWAIPALPASPCGFFLGFCLSCTGELQTGPKYSRCDLSELSRGKESPQDLLATLGMIQTTRTNPKLQALSKLFHCPLKRGKKSRNWVKPADLGLLDAFLAGFVASDSRHNFPLNSREAPSLQIY